MKSIYALLVFLCLSPWALADSTLSDADIAKRLIQESIDAYPGNCPCPYNLARNGSRCGKRSAYNRAGGYAPLCFEEDVSPEMLKRYRLQTEAKQKTN